MFKRESFDDYDPRSTAFFSSNANLNQSFNNVHGLMNSVPYNAGDGFALQNSGNLLKFVYLLEIMYDENFFILFSRFPFCCSWFNERR